MTEMFDKQFDIVVIGSGGAAFGAALGAVDEGLSVVMLESTDKWGGSTAMSGGGMWLPNNPLMQRDGAGDSRAEALAYLDAVVEYDGAASSPQRRAAFVDSVEDFVSTSERFGIRFARAKDYPDYYPEEPGGKIGRALEIEPLNSRRIGKWYDSLRILMPIPIKTDDVWLLARAWSTPAGFVRGARFVFRTLGGLVTGQRKVGIGAAFATAYLKAVVVESGAELWLNSPAEELVLDDDGAVVGVKITQDGETVTVGASRGVMLAGGGFDHNTELRREHHGIAGDSSGNPGNLGGPISLGEQAGAALELMDDAWWGASIAPAPGVDASFIVGERSLPHSIIVNAKGERFANEAESYVDLGHHMLEQGADQDFWFILDSRHTARYLRTFALDPKANKAMAEAGILHKDPTLSGLAHKLGLDVETFRATVERFNGFARTGIDHDFGKGNSAYDRYYGDPTVRPNPCLGAIAKPPFTAYRIVLGDLGTKGGVLTDEHARALRSDGSIIPGLYAAGNNSASVMGRTYPGPGSTIAPAVIFGLRGARHMSQQRA